MADLEYHVRADVPAERARRDWPEWPDIFGRRFSDWFGFPELTRLPGTRILEENVLRVEEKVEGDELVVRAEMPGIDPEKDVQIHVRNHMLELRAERRQEEETEEEGRYRSEFRYGSFTRVLPLPPDADEQDVKASYTDGILEVRMPLDKKQAQATKIEVERK